MTVAGMFRHGYDAASGRLAQLAVYAGGLERWYAALGYLGLIAFENAAGLAWSWFQCAGSRPSHMRQWIVQHTPKCAGASLRLALLKVFGEGQIYRDYGEGLADPTSLFAMDRAGYWRNAEKLAPRQAVIMGHFPIRKYRHIGNATRIGTIRHPVARTVSHYCYWLSPRVYAAHPLREYVVRSGLDVVSFARLPAIENYYRNLFFSGVTATDYDLMIDQEHFAEGLVQLGKMIGRPLDVLQVNVTAPEGGRRILNDAAINRQLNEILSPEIALYEALCSPRR